MTTGERLLWLSRAAAMSLVSATLLAGTAHAQQSTIKSVDCTKVYDLWPAASNVKGLEIAAEIADPRGFLDDGAFFAELDAILKAGLKTCRERGETQLRLAQVTVFAAGESIYVGRRGGNETKWSSSNDSRGWSIPRIVQAIDYARQRREAADREPASVATQEDFCGRFARHRATVFALEGRRKTEQNPLQARQIDADIAEANRRANDDLSPAFGTGLRRFAGYHGTMTSLTDAGFGNIRMSLTLQCPAVPIVFDLIFGNDRLDDPPDVNSTYMSSLPRFQSLLATLRNGDRLRVAGIIKRFTVATRELFTVSLTTNAIALRVRLTEIAKE